jgi:predicted small secreted protein
MLAASPHAWQADLDPMLVVPLLALAYLFLAGCYGTRSGAGRGDDGRRAGRRPLPRLRLLVRRFLVEEGAL